MTKFDLSRDLYPYQAEDADRMSSDGNWLNLSEMGVGKTPVAIQVVEQGNYQLPLIICPNSLKLEWRRQISEWTDQQCVTSKQDPYTKFGDIIRSLKRGDAKYIITNYETLRSDQHLELLNLIPFDCIIFDEVHKLRNPKTKLTRGVWKFLNSYPSAKILCLTGSPIVNYPNDLYTTLSLAKPKEYPRDLKHWRWFMYEYCYWTEGRYGPYIYGSRRLPQLKQRMEPFTVGRTKEEILPFLPEKYYQRTELEMKPDQRKLYNQMENELRILLDDGEPLWSTSVLATLTRLRQINLDPEIVGVTCSSAKTEYLSDLVQSATKLVIFSCFERYIHLLHLLLEKLKVKHIVITGEVASDKRIPLVQQFQNDDKIRVCLGTLQTMGEGLTLTAASTVALVDRWWNEPMNQQAIDRLHRIGQKNAVQVLLPICSRSVDEALDAILQRKYEASQAYYKEDAVREQILVGALGSQPKLNSC